MKLLSITGKILLREVGFEVAGGVAEDGVEEKAGCKVC